MTAIIAILAVAGLVWGVVLAMRGSLLAGCLTYLVLVCCCGPWFYYLDVGGITFTIDRLFFVGLVGTYVVQWRLGRVQPTPLTLIDLAVIALMGLIVISTFTHDFRAAPPTKIGIVQHMINGYAIPVALYWIARQIPFNERTLKIMLGALVVFGIYLSLTGIFESLGMWSLVYPTYIGDPKVGTHFGRARGPMVQAVSYGFYVACCLLAGWLLCRHLKSRAWQLAVALTVPLMGVAVLLTLTRSVWLGLAAGLFIVLACTLRGRVRSAVLGTMVVAGLVAGITKYESFIGFAREDSAEITRHSTGMRAKFTYVSWQMFKDKPLFGFGFGQFTGEKLKYLGDRSVDLVLEDIRKYSHHSTFLNILVELGLVGLLAFMAVKFGWTFAMAKLLRDGRAPPAAHTLAALSLAVLAMAALQMVVHETSFTPIDNALMYLLAGLTVGVYARRAATQSSAMSQPASYPRDRRMGATT